MKCPSCYEIIADGLDYCECGWRKTPKKSAKQAGDSAGRDWVCTFTLDDGSRCTHAVGWLPSGARNGYCAEHTKKVDVGIPCPPEIRAQLRAFLERAVVTPGRRLMETSREPGSDDV